MGRIGGINMIEEQETEYEREERLFQEKALGYKKSKFKCSGCSFCSFDRCTLQHQNITRIHSCDYNSNEKTKCREDNKISQCPDSADCKKCKYSKTNKKIERIKYLKSEIRAINKNIESLETQKQYIYQKIEEKKISLKLYEKNLMEEEKK
jgi:hypothetical protein